MSFEDRLIPVGLSKIDDGRIAITWKDGATLEYAVDRLRAKCPCANCVDEWTGVVKINYDDVRGTGFKSITPVGSYAFTIRFSDGHDTGIYTFQRLRQLGEVWAETESQS
ncbi:MAG: DUF971 domain-containing protein [Planctomycetes bacterium]|nr:DUF971 domain-containing protein [Planctomycetota bacterium]